MYGLFTGIKDVGNQNWNRVDWHNNITYGIGVRARLHPLLPTFLTPRDYNIDIFFEYLWVNYVDDNLFFIGHRPNTDIRSGIAYWYAKGKPNAKKSWSGYMWVETAGAFYYARNSFFNQSQTNYYMASTNNRLGAGIQFAKTKFTNEIYVIGSILKDFGGKLWNELDWNNNQKYGFGFRLKYARFLSPKFDEVNIFATAYVNFLWVEYLDKISYLPGYRPDKDVQFGIQINLSLTRSGYQSRF